MDLGAVRDMDFEPFVKAHLSSPQRLLLVNTSERKRGKRERWREKTGARGTVGA